MILTGLAPDPRRPGYHLVEIDRGRFAEAGDPQEEQALSERPWLVGW